MSDTGKQDRGSEADRAETSRAPDLTAHKDSIRLARPDPAQASAPVHIVRLRGVPGKPDLVPLKEHDRPDPLVIPAGPEGNAERQLARGDTAAASAIATVLMGPPDPDATTISATQAVGRTIRARAQLMEGKLGEAQATLGAARSDPQLALADAAVLLVEGELERCEARLEKALEQRPEGIGEFYTLALLRVAQGEVEEAMRLLVRVCASDPEHAVARHQLGRLMLAEGDPARAGTLFEQAFEISSGFVAPALTLAEMFVDSRQFGEAMNLLNQVADVAPSLLTPRVLQLRILVEARRTPAALHLADALRQAAPDREDVILLWAEALMQAERGEQARGAMEALLPRPDVDHLRIRRTLTRLDLMARPPRVDSAIEHLEAAVAVDTSGGEVLVELAQLQLAARRQKDAEDTLQRLMAADEIELGVLLSAAVMANKHGLPELARKIGEEAVERVAGTPAEAQLRSLLGSIGDQ